MRYESEHVEDVAVLQSTSCTVAHPPILLFAFVWRCVAQANERGITELHAMIDQFTLPVVQAYMQYVMDNAEECVRRVIDVLQDGEFTYADDDGGQITCKVSIDQVRSNGIWGCCQLLR